MSCDAEFKKKKTRHLLSHLIHFAVNSLSLVLMKWTCSVLLKSCVNLCNLMSAVNKPYTKWYICVYENSHIMQSRRFFCQEERWNSSKMLDKANIFFISYLFSRLQIWMRTISEVHLNRIASLDYYAYTLVEITGRISPRIIRKGVRKIGSQNYSILLQEE